MAETLDLVSDEAIEKTRKERSRGRSRSGVRRLREKRKDGAADDPSLEVSAGVLGDADHHQEPSERTVSSGPDRILPEERRQSKGPS